MNIINIALKEIKRDFRDTRTLVFLLAFPILLMLVLGTALSGAFTNSISIDKMQVLYKDTTSGSFGQHFDPFIKEAKKSGIHFIKETSETEGKEKEEVKQDNFDGYLEIGNEEIKLFLNESNSIDANILQGMLSSFIDKYNIASEVVKVDANKIGAAYSGGVDHNFITESSLLPKKQPGSMDYYAIAITTMIVLYGAMSATSLIIGERVRKTADRLIASPVRKSEIFIGKVLGSIVINVVCILLVIIFSKIFFKANWGNHLWLVLLVILTEIILAISMGIGVSYMTKSTANPKVIVMLIIQLASFFGGAYFKIENPEGYFKFITDLSPLTWVNTAITKIIYTNDLTAALPAMIFNISISIIFFLIAIISLKRREGL